MEIVDCVLSIFLFEIYRLFRSGRTLYSKEQFQFKILYFFSRLKTSKVLDDKSMPIISACFDDNGDPEVLRRRRKDVTLDEDSSGSDNEGGLCELIDQLNLECSSGKKAAPLPPCGNCRVKVKENLKFMNLYKHLIEDIVKNIS